MKKKENNKGIALVLLLTAMLFITAACKKENPQPEEVGSVFIDTIITHTTTSIETTDSEIIVKNTMSTNFDLLYHRITVGHLGQSYDGGIMWMDSAAIPAGGELHLFPADLGMSLFVSDEIHPFFARFFDENDNQFQEYIDG